MGRFACSLVLALALSSCAGGAAPREPAKAPASATPAGSAPAKADENRFYSPVAGIRIDKQPSWSFMSLEHELANRQAVSVGNANTDAVMHDSTTAPLVVIARYPEPSEKPNPTLKITLRALADLRDTPPVEIARAVAQTMSLAIPSFVVDGDARALQVGGLPGGTFRAHFTLEVPHLGRTFAVNTEAWIVPRGEYAVLIVTSDPTGGAGNYDPDFQAMVKSVVIEK